MKFYKTWFPCLNSMLLYIAACYNFCLKFYYDIIYKNTQNHLIQKVQEMPRLCTEILYGNSVQTCRTEVAALDLTAHVHPRSSEHTAVWL